MSDPRRDLIPKEVRFSDPETMKNLTLEQQYVLEDVCSDLFWEVARLCSVDTLKADELLKADGGDGVPAEVLLMDRWIEGEDIEDLAKEII